MSAEDIATGLLARSDMRKVSVGPPPAVTPVIDSMASARVGASMRRGSACTEEGEKLVPDDAWQAVAVSSRSLPHLDDRVGRKAHGHRALSR